MGFATESRERLRPVLPLAGMVDILFLLLVFFMLASRFDRESVLPLVVRSTSSSESAFPAEDVLRIEIGPTGDTTIDGRIASPERIRSEASRAAREGRNVRVRPDPETGLQSIVDALGTLDRAGVTDAALERQ